MKKHTPAMNKQIAIIGEVLFDQFPDDQQILGGAPFNVAWHLQAFGQRPCFISRVGNDVLGRQIRSAMATWNMNTDNLQIDPDYPTGRVSISFNHGEPDYQILDNQAYDFIDSNQIEPTAQYHIIYHGTLALRHIVSEQTVQQLKLQNNGKVFIDVNLREPWWQAGQVKQWLTSADWLKLNRHELALLAPEQDSLENTMRRLLQEYELEILVVTCGSQGAIAMTHNDVFEVAPVTEHTVVDTVGAGDAFAAVMLLGMEYGWPLPLTMNRAQDFASALVTQKGATVQELRFYQRFIDDWNLKLE